MATENGVYSTICTMGNKVIPNNLHGTSNMFNFHPALYSLTQKAVIINTCHIVGEFMTKMNKKYLAG